MDIDELYEMAGCGPEDIDLLQTYDDYPVISMMQFEDLGFCAKGEGARFVREHDLTITGDFPHNTSGGQLSVGQAGAAGGYLGLVEAIRQVTGVAGADAGRQSAHGRVSGFGMINYDRGLCSSAAILRGWRMTDKLAPPKKKNPQKRQMVPTLAAARARARRSG
jgi:acetyl-CoA acetyltransferase